MVVIGVIVTTNVLVAPQSPGGVAPGCVGGLGRNRDNVVSLPVVSSAFT